MTSVGSGFVDKIYLFEQKEGFFGSVSHYERFEEQNEVFQTILVTVFVVLKSFSTGLIRHKLNRT